MTQILHECLVMITLTMVIGTLLGYSWPAAKSIEMSERIKKLANRPRKKSPTMGDINWELYLRDVNDTRDNPVQS